MLRYIALVAVTVALAGCALAPTHDSKIAAPLAAASLGNVDEALRALDAKTESKDKTDLLLNLERGELLRIDARYRESLASFEVADVKVNEWEATARSAPEKLMGQLGATMFGETFKTFEGQDYEKVMLTTRMAMNRISLGDLDNARVDVKRTHEREAVIAEFRAKETAAAEEEAKTNGITGEAKELNGYPIETLNDPEVLQLKNGYQNALSHYMAGFVYEALNEPSLAAPGYRKAIELRPGLPMLEEGLRGLDQRTSSARPRGFTDVLFVIEIGNAPARKSQRITFPIPSRKGLIIVPLAFPVIRPNPTPPMVDQISVGDKALPTALIADFNVMARRALKDELPGIQLRAAIRAIGKGAIQEGLNRQSGLLGLFGNVAAVATESEADDRMWRALPERVFVTRSFIAPGDYVVRLPALQDNQLRLTVEGRYMVVPIRMFETKAYFAQPTHFGTADRWQLPSRRHLPRRLRPRHLPRRRPRHPRRRQRALLRPTHPPPHRPRRHRTPPIPKQRKPPKLLAPRIREPRRRRPPPPRRRLPERSLRQVPPARRGPWRRQPIRARGPSRNPRERMRRSPPKAPRCRRPTRRPPPRFLHRCRNERVSDATNSPPRIRFDEPNG